MKASLIDKLKVASPKRHGSNYIRGHTGHIKWRNWGIIQSLYKVRGKPHIQTWHQKNESQRFHAIAIKFGFHWMLFLTYHNYLNSNTLLAILNKNQHLFFFVNTTDHGNNLFSTRYFIFILEQGLEYILII